MMRKNLLKGGVVVVVALAVTYYFVWYEKDTVTNEIQIIQKADFIQTISISGKVIPAKSVELGFNKSGKISNVGVEVGQNVRAGQLIAELDYQDATLALENAQIELKKMTENSSLSGPLGLDKDSEDSLNTINQVFSDLPTVINGLDGVLNNYRNSSYLANLPNETSRNYYKIAQSGYYKSLAEYQKVLTDYKQATQPVSPQTVKSLVEETYSMLQTLTQAAKDTNLHINYIYDYELKAMGTVSNSVLISDRTNINTWLETTNDSLALVTANRDALKNSDFDIEGQRLVVKQKENDLVDYFLRAPFSGIITRLDIETGELAIAGQATVTMINSGLFQIESFVPEINIANIKVGNPAKITLDAYGSDLVFDARVISIDPAETIRDGVSTYKVTFQFSKFDSRIKSGMTANIILTTLSKPGVISVSPRTIITLGEKKFVQIKVGEQIIKQPVTIGSIGTLGQTEIISGLKEGDSVIVNPKAD